jgi:chromosome segregation ATPase
VLENHAEALNAVCNATLKNITDINTCATDISANQSKITSVDKSINDLDKRVQENESVLENHHEALNAVCNATLRNISDINTCAANITANQTKITTVETRLETKFDSCESLINEYIAKTDAVLKNHYDALLTLCQKHGMVDSNPNDGSNVTPK